MRQEEWVFDAFESCQRLQRWFTVTGTPTPLMLPLPSSLSLSAGHSWIWSINMTSFTKDIFEPRTTASSQLFILYSPLLRPGGGDVNTNRWCPAPSAMRCSDGSCSLLLWYNWIDGKCERKRGAGEETKGALIHLSGRWSVMEVRVFCPKLIQYGDKGRYTGCEMGQK